MAWGDIHDVTDGGLFQRLVAFVMCEREDFEFGFAVEDSMVVIVRPEDIGKSRGKPKPSFRKLLKEVPTTVELFTALYQKYS